MSRPGSILRLCLRLSGTALAFYLALIVVPASRHPNTNGFAAYYTASRTLIDAPRDLNRLYDDSWFQGRIDGYGFQHVLDIYNVQPPTMSLMLVPIAWMPPAPARAVWIALNVALWIAGLALLVQSLDLFRGRARYQPVLLLGGLTTFYVPLTDNFRQGQSYTFLFFLLCLFFRLAVRPGSRPTWLAGLPLGLMFVVKTAGFWLWPLLLVSRQWRLLLCAAVTAMAVTLLAAPVIGWTVWDIYFHQIPRLASEPVRYMTAYQTVASLTGHLFVFDPTCSPTPVASLGRVATILGLLVTLVVFVVSARLERLASDDLSARALSLALFTAPIVSLAPFAESYHYVLVLPAIVVAFWSAVRRGSSRASWAILCIATLLVITPCRLYQARYLETGWLALLAYPRLYGALALWGWLACAIRNIEGPRPHSYISGEGSGIGSGRPHGRGVP
jgi:Glycosyltransferase family 87